MLQVVAKICSVSTKADVMFTKNTCVLLNITPASFVTNPKYFQTLLFALVLGAFRCSTELPTLLLMLLLNDFVPLIWFSIIKLTYMLHLSIKNLYWYRDSKFHIDILIYIAHPYNIHRYTEMYLAYALTVAYSSNFSSPIAFTCMVCQNFSPPKLSHVR